MSNSTAQNELKSLIKGLSDDDLIWLLHVKNKDQIEYNDRTKISDDDELLIKNNIQDLNALQDINEIKSIVYNYAKNFSDYDIEKFINQINYFKSRLEIRSIKFSKYKSDERLLNIALNSIMDKNKRYPIDTRVLDINNPYVRFLYVIYTHSEYYRNPDKIARIEEKYSTIQTKNELHFKKQDSTEFYRWAKNYMDNDLENARRFNSKNFKPINDPDFKIAVNSIFDNLLLIDKLQYQALKDKLSNAWYQKTYRKNNKGKKYYFFLKDKTDDALNMLAKKYNISTVDIIERLINECYVKECLDSSGNPQYNL